MEELLAPVDRLSFEMEHLLENQIGSLALPFPGMDKSSAAVCVFHLAGACPMGPQQCPYRHVRGDRTVVCKHWLRGLCKKGDACEFLHEFDMSKMPECYFYSRFHACTNKECPFLHIDPESKIRDCPWYDRGFCRHGPTCRHRHVRRVLCLNYLCGFCPDGPDCKQVHPKFDLPNQHFETSTGPVKDEAQQSTSDGIPDGVPPQGSGGGWQPGMGRGGRPPLVCHGCGEPGHKIYKCPKTSQERKDQVIASKIAGVGQDPRFAVQDQSQNQSHHGPSPHMQSHAQNQLQGPPSGGPRGPLGPRGPGGFGGLRTEFIPRGPSEHSGERPFRSLDQVTCFKCGERGHYANRCPKGHLAFLSSALQRFQRPTGPGGSSGLGPQERY